MQFSSKRNRSTSRKDSREKKRFWSRTSELRADIHVVFSHSSPVGVSELSEA